MKKKMGIGVVLLILIALVAMNTVSVFGYAASFTPLSEDDLALYVARPVNEGTVEFDLDGDGNLVITNIGGSYPDLGFSTMEEFDAAKKIFLDYDFTIEKGQGQIAFYGAGGPSSEWKLGQTIGSGDLEANTYTGTLELTDEANKAAAALIADDYLTITGVNIFCINDGCKITVRKLDIYEEGSKPGEKPTVDPNATPTMAPTTAPPTETPATPTLAPTTAKPTPTKAPATATTKPDDTEKGGIDTWVIVVIVVAVAAVAGGLIYYFAVVKKKNK